MSEIDIGETIKNNIDYWKKLCFEQKERIKELEEYKKITELTKISCCTAQNCEALNNAIREGLENNKLKERIVELEEIEKEHQKQNGELQEKIKELKQDKLDLIQQHNVVKMKDVQEELNAIRDELDKKQVEINLLTDINNISYVSKDKIKAKIEEYKKNKENYTFTLKSEDIRRTIITVLQELLEGGENG